MAKSNLTKKGELTTARKKQIDEMCEKRVVLLSANKRIKCDSMDNFYAFITFFTPIKDGFMKYVKFELVQKAIYDDYLVKIWIDENNIFHAEDDFPEGNWFMEVNRRKLEKIYDAFGFAEESDLWL